MANILTKETAEAANISLTEPGEGTQAVHDVVVAMRANRRSGTANTKTRGEVAQSGKKPFRQKGTGNARQGGNASPLHRGGGVVFGPRPRDYSKQVNRKTKKIAFTAALTNRIDSGEVIVVDEFKIDSGKTKSFVAEKDLQPCLLGPYAALLFVSETVAVSELASRWVSSRRSCADSY